MSRVVYFDCFAGASGDMLLASLLHAGVPLDGLRAALQALPLDGYAIEATEVVRQGIAGVRFEVRVDTEHQPHRHLADIEALIQGAGDALPVRARERALAVFRRLARAEAKVHGTTPDEVHFHEVGAVDSIVDIVGFAVALELAGVEEVYASPLPLGRGFVRTAHGTLPLPAPATLEILAESGAPTVAVDVEGETVTPTGAAILSELAHFRRPELRLSRVGYGFGKHEGFPWPNAVRAWLGETRVGNHGRVVLLECNLDNVTGEALGYAMERLFAAGALDVWFTPIQMKKNRPAVVLSVIAAPNEADRLAEAVLRETPTLGLRWLEVERRTAERRTETVRTPWGEVRVKVKVLDGEVVLRRPEYEDCARIARQHGVPLEDVVQAALAAT
ncbi:MAG: nickel pincer cofactor biosynthesis protein LarC [Anaerolineales bacterium]